MTTLRTPWGYRNESIAVYLGLDRLLWTDERMLLHKYLTLLFLGICYAALLLSEVYYLYEMGKFKEIVDKTVVLKDISGVWEENEGKIVYFQGFLKTNDELITDRDFGVSISAPLLIREAEMYQWIKEAPSN